MIWVREEALSLVLFLKTDAQEEPGPPLDYSGGPGSSQKKHVDRPGIRLNGQHLLCGLFCPGEDTEERFFANPGIFCNFR
jgi:hypothetical protein